MKTVWVLISLFCSGHVNSKCEFVIKNYSTQQQCVVNMKENDICLPVNGQSYGGKNGK